MVRSARKTVPSVLVKASFRGNLQRAICGFLRRFMPFRVFNAIYCGLMCGIASREKASVDHRILLVYADGTRQVQIPPNEHEDDKKLHSSDCRDLGIFAVK